MILHLSIHNLVFYNTQYFYFIPPQKFNESVSDFSELKKFLGNYDKVLWFVIDLFMILHLSINNPIFHITVLLFFNFISSQKFNESVFDFSELKFQTEIMTKYCDFYLIDLWYCINLYTILCFTTHSFYILILFLLKNSMSHLY